MRPGIVQVQSTRQGRGTRHQEASPAWETECGAYYRGPGPKAGGLLSLPPTSEARSCTAPRVDRAQKIRIADGL